MEMAEIKIKVLGPGCAACEKLLDTATMAAKELGGEADVEYIKDMAEIARYVMLTPGLVINEKVVHQGKPLPGVNKIKSLVKKAAGS
jgi:small redox-active disulfide protein 2